MDTRILLLYTLTTAFFICSCSGKKKADKIDIPTWEETIKKNIDPTIDVYGHYAAVKLPIKHGVTLWNPTDVAIGPGGRVYAANYTGEIYSLQDTDGDGLEDHAKLYCDVKNDSLRYPTSMIFNGNKLYVGTTQEIRIYEDTDSDEVADDSYTFFTGFPYTLHPFDWTFGLEFGPDGYLYAILCTDSWNDDPAVDPEGLRGSILKIAPDGKSYKRFASGLRFAYGMRFNEHGDLFFTDNRGNENKYEELNFAIEGRFYGNNPSKYPDQSKTTEALVKLQYGFSPTGITFNKKDNDFDGTAGDLFIAFWGPDGQWEDGSLSRVRLSRKDDNQYDAQEFAVADKIAKISDVEFGSQGDLYVSQFGTEDRWHKPWKEPMGAIYRFIEAPWVELDDPNTNTSIVFGNIHHGLELFNERLCATCHSVDGRGDLIGPDLLGLGELSTPEQTLESITDPGKNIKSGFDHVIITKKDGSAFSGRILTTNENEISMMTAANEIIEIKRDDIDSRDMMNTSLMPPGLLGGLTKGEINDLLGYLQSLKLEF